MHDMALLVQEVLQRLRQRRMSRLSHSQHEIEGILHCSEPEEELSDSADELDDPAGREPPAGPQTSAAADPVDQPDMEDMGALAHDLQDAGLAEQQQQAAGETLLSLYCSNQLVLAACQSPISSIRDAGSSAHLHMLSLQKLVR